MYVVLSGSHANQQGSCGEDGYEGSTLIDKLERKKITCQRATEKFLSFGAYCSPLLAPHALCPAFPLSIVYMGPSFFLCGPSS